MATAPNTNLEGVNLYAMPALAQFDPNAILYAVLGEKDYHVRMEMLVQIVKEGVNELQIPDDVVRRQAMETYVRSAVEGIVIPKVSVTSETLADQVNALEAIKSLKQSIQTLTADINNLSPEGLDNFILKNAALKTNVAIGVNASGELTNVQLGSSRVVYVYGNSQDTRQRYGTFDAPFNTIQEAIDSINPAITNAVILVLPSTDGDYNGFVVENRSNITIQGFGCTDAHSVRIRGEIINRGAAGTRLRLKDLQLRQMTRTSPAYTSIGTQGRDYFKNVTIEPVISDQTEALVSLNDVQNWIDFEDCNINGLISINGTGGAGALVAMRNCNASGTQVLLDSEVKVLLNGNTRFGYIEQKKGELEVNYCHSFTGKDGYAINSQGGQIRLAYSNFQTTDGSYLKIQRKVDQDPVRLANCNLSPTVSVEGPVSYQERTIIKSLLQPSFALEVPAAVDGIRSIKVKRLATAGYYYEELDAKISQVATGTKVEDAINNTVFTMAYAEKEKTVEMPVGPGLNEIYLVLTDPNNNNAKFVFGPYNN